jgi:hypothetical protein
VTTTRTAASHRKLRRERIVRDLLLLPRPKKIRMLSGKHVLRDKHLAFVRGMTPEQGLFTGERLRGAMLQHAGVSCEMVFASSVRGDVEIDLAVSKQPGLPGQAYRLNIKPRIITVEAGGPSGAFYGVCTLIQIIERCGRSLPCLRIEDSPDFQTRGVMLDISRSKVPRMETLFRLIDMLAGWKINHVELYTEHTFAYRKHRAVWKDSSPMTGEEIVQLDAWCRQRHIDLVPNQNSFGHFERWLKHPAYAPLAEFPGNNTLCPTDKRTIRLISELYAELLPHFSSRLFNVGCDETVIGKGRSRPACREKGEGRVYLEFLLDIHRLVRQHHRTMMFWGDIIVRHPELVKELPKDIIALSWGYEADTPFDEQGAMFAASGIPFYVCPGTSSWLSVAGRTDNCIGNLLNAARHGLKHGAAGYLITDWGDCGHWQYLPVSYLGFAYGAGVSWCLKRNRDMPLENTLSLRGFNDSTGNMGKLAYDLGNAGTVTGLYIPNDSPLFNIMQFHKLEDPSIIRRMEPSGIRKARRQIEKAMSRLEKTRMKGEDTELIKHEFRNAAALLRHACNRADVVRKLDDGTPRKALRKDLRKLKLDMESVMSEHRRLWRSRNRPGGLRESLAFMKRLIAEYSKA